MSATNYEKQILDTIQKLVDNAVQNASYDKTIQCTILKVQDAAMGKYKVKYQDSAFYAYSTTTDVTYAAGKSVYVLVPGNDMASNKTIIGTVDSLGADYINNISIENRYDIIGNNIASSEDIFGLCSYKSGGDSVVLYDYDNDINLINYNAEAADLYIKKGTALLLGAYFKTDLPTEQKFRGNYGISFETTYADEAGEPVERNFIIDIDNMNGNPYNLVNFTKQISAYELDGLKFQSINKIQIFSDNFPHTATGKEDDIFVKDIQIYSAEAIPEEELTNCGLSLITPQGIYFDNQSAATAVREIQAQVRVKGKAASDDFSNLSFYWFKENVGITINSEKYNKLGGSGWECLNEYNVIDRTDPDHLLIEWNAAGSSISVMKRENAAKENRYKCVAVYNTDTILEKEITIYNLSSSYDITIASSNGTQFYFDVGTTNLSCLINGTLQTDSKYTYSWGAVDFYGSFKNLEETSNTYENVAVNEIINYTVYKCSVWYDGDYIGTNSIILYNSLEKAQNYNLVINNGVQVYKYDTNGIAPNNKSLDNPITLLPLTFILFDDMGQEIPASGIPGSAIKWKVPIDDTMIIIPNEYGTPTIEDGYYIYTNIYSLGYDIATRYNINASENNIELNIDYEGVSYKAVTNLSFIKEGESGTNGTDFICKIVPNIATGELNDYPMVTYNEDTESYSLNYTPTSQNLWFKVQLWHDGIKIFENVVSGNSNVEQDEEGNFKEVDVSWSILKNRYTKNQSLNVITEDSNLSINAATGAVTFDATEYTDPANIVKCTVTYDGMTYYDTMPVIVSRIENSNYTLKLKKNSGFRYAIYSTDGRYPQYDNNQPFEIVTLNQGTDISSTSTYIWEVYGSSYINGWQDEVNIIPRKTYGQILKTNQKYYKPVDEFNGLSVNNGISVATEIGSIQIPIHLYLNKYSNALMNDWDGNSIQIKEDEGLILSPQVGAGKKEQDNSFTGVFLGSIEETGKEVETGLFGYSSGERTIALDASDGSARFGKTGSGQIVIDPSTNQAILTSGNYDTTEGTGMQINLSEPSINWGNGNFSIDSNGKVVATQLYMTSGSDKTVQQEITSLDNATSILQINPITNNLIIPCDTNHKPFETKQYTIQCYPKFKNIDVSGVTCSFNPSSITNLSYYWSVANKNIIVTVNSANAIQNTTNLITATFTYIDSNNVTWTQVQQFNISLGLQGTQGIQGEPGPDGESSYFHYYYSDVINPSGFSQMTKTPSEFMGTYVDKTAEDSTDPSDYTWFKLEGTDGEAGLDGFSIWIASTAPSSNTYLKSQLSGPSASQTPKVGEIVISENRYQYTITKVDGKTITVGSNTEENVLLNRSGSRDTSSPITVTVDYSGLVVGDLLRINLEMGYESGGYWHPYYGSADLVWTGEIQTVTVTMPNNNRPCTCVLNPSTSQISCSFSTSDFYGGYITLTKAITKVDLKGEKGDNGESGTSPYISYLTNEAQTFAAGTAKTIKTSLYAYQGTTEKNVQIKSVNGVTASTSSTATGKTGMNFYVNSTSSVAHPEITFSATISLPQTQTEQLEIKYIISGENTERSVYFSYSSTTTGSSGAAASLVDITASSQMFKSIDGGATFSPNTIVLTPRFQTVTYSKWQYSDDGGSTYTHDVVSGQHGFTINNGVLTIAKTCDLFTDNVTALSFKCISSNANVYDTITIIKLYDTTDIEIGGRNYISNLEGNWQNGNWIIPNVGEPTEITTYNGRISLKRRIEIEPETSYWIKVYSTKNIKALFRVCDEDDNFIRSDIDLVDQQWVSSVNDKYLHLTIYDNSDVSDIANEITKVKFEKGNVATDWTMAPEDIDTNISTSTQTAVNQSIVNIIPHYCYRSDGLKPKETDTWTTPLDETHLTDTMYIWQRDKIIYGNDSFIWSEIHSIKNKISYITEYAAWDSSDTAPEEESDEWKEAKPDTTDKYIWTRTTTNWDTGLVTHSTPICDTLAKRLQDSLNQMGLSVSELSESGYVRIFDNYIYLVNAEEMRDVRAGIAMGLGGIQFFKYPEGDVPGETRVETEWDEENKVFKNVKYNSVWSLGGTMDLEALRVQNINASEIKDGILTLGEDANTEGRLEVYKVNGKINGDDPVVKIDGNGVEVKLANGGWAKILDTNGITLIDANNNLVFGSDTNLDRFNMTKATVTSEINFDSKIIAQPTVLTDTNNIDHHGLAFIRGGN